ncbi:MAG: undecaprenyl-phosphate glucose phosphotransferase [Alphaproteobacteria bacterium]|nr:undecaprenyl-phosphate glucose phosphotransferase [Alphaproteobacteria bacterium]
MAHDTNDEIESLMTGREKSFPLSSSVVIGMFVLLDGILLLGSGGLSYLLIVRGPVPPPELYLAAVVFIWLVSLLLFNHGGLYDFTAIMAPTTNVFRLGVACGAAFLLLLAIAFSLKISAGYSRLWMFSYGLLAFSAIFTARMIGYLVISHLANIGIFARKVLIVGGSARAEKLIELMALERPCFNHVAGVFDDRLERVGPNVGRAPMLGNLDDLIKYVRTHRVDDIIIALPWSAEERLSDIIGRLRDLPTNIHLEASLGGFRFPLRPSPNPFIGVPMVEVVKLPLSGWHIGLKSLEDRVLGLLLLLLFLPVLVLIAVAVRLDSKGPVLFLQKRYGYNNQVFDIYKFRSMYHGGVRHEKTIQATRDDPRITRVGGFIRRTSLDELPQLFNVVFGTMSLVGPRPHTIDINEEFATLIRGYFARHRVKPGITGWAQVNGLRGETDTLEKMEERVRYDTYYAENWSLLFDLQILVKTAFVGFLNRNAY